MSSTDQPPSPRRWIIGDVGGKPALQRIASQPLTCLVAAEKILRRVARPAMSEAFRQIRAAIPFFAFVGRRLECARRKEQHVPKDHRRANIERKWQLVCVHRIVDGRNGVEIGADRQRIVARDLGVVGIWHGRIKMRAVAAGALLHSVDEFVIRPGADAGLSVGRDVRRKHVAERRLDGTPAGEIVTAPRQCVARGAIADDRQVAAALDLLEILFVDIAGARRRRTTTPAPARRRKVLCELS